MSSHRTPRTGDTPGRENLTRRLFSTQKAYRPGLGLDLGELEGEVAPVLIERRHAGDEVHAFGVQRLRAVPEPWQRGKGRSANMQCKNEWKKAYE